jgi:uncharacterized protein
MIRSVASVPASSIRLLIRLYQLTVSPLLGPSCRYQPSCSEYARQAVTKFGALKGVYLAAARLLRCHPWGGSGYDPVPEVFPGRPAHGAPAKRCRHG